MPRRRRGRAGSSRATPPCSRAQTRCGVRGPRSRTRTQARCSCPPPKAGSSADLGGRHHLGGGSHGSLVGRRLRGAGPHGRPRRRRSGVDHRRRAGGPAPLRRRAPGLLRAARPCRLTSSASACAWWSASCAAGGFATSGCWRRWRGFRASCSFPKDCASTRTPTARSRSAATRRSRSPSSSRRCASCSVSTATSACSTSARAPATRPPCSPSSPPRSSRSSGSPSSPSRRGPHSPRRAIREVDVRVGDGTLGAPDRAPFHGIAVAAAAPRIPPALYEQLQDGGRLVAAAAGRGTRSGSCSSSRTREGPAERASVAVPLRPAPRRGGLRRAVGVAVGSATLAPLDGALERGDEARDHAARGCAARCAVPTTGCSSRSSALVGATRLRRQPRRLHAARASGPASTTCSPRPCSFLVAVTNNYTWNRLWTFRHQRGHVAYQGLRFLVVSTIALCANLRRPVPARAGGDVQGAGAGDRDRARHPAELRRQQAVVVRARVEPASE